jgi:hypothetical protein
METSKRLKAALSGLPAAERRRFAREAAALPEFDAERDVVAQAIVVPQPPRPYDCPSCGWRAPSALAFYADRECPWCGDLLWF